MKIEHVGRGYYSVNQMKERRKRQQAKLQHLDQLIDRAQRLSMQRNKVRTSKYLLRNNQIISLHNQGLTLAEIGHLFKITKNRVCQIVSNGNGKSTAKAQTN